MADALAKTAFTSATSTIYTLLHFLILSYYSQKVNIIFNNIYIFLFIYLVLKGIIEP